VIEPQKIKKILIIQPRGTGDVVRTTVLFHNLKHHFQHASLDYLTDPINHQVLDGLPVLNKVLGIDIRKTGTIKTLGIIRKNKYDLVIDLYGNPRTALITRLSGAIHRVGFKTKKRTYAYNHLVSANDPNISTIDRYFILMKALNIQVVDNKLYFPVERANTKIIDEFFKHFESSLKIGLLLAGGWASKKFPGKRMAELGKKIKTELNAEIFVGYGPGEKSDFEEFKLHADFEFNLLPDKGFTDVGYSSSKLDLVIVNDSGPMHVASAVGTKVLGIFGPTNPKNWAPYGEENKWVRNEKLDCIACEKLNCPIPNHPCMNELDLNEVLDIVKKMLKADNKQVTTDHSKKLSN